MESGHAYPRQVLLHIGGRWCDGDAGRTLPVVNPATGIEMSRLARAEESDLARAAAAADQAQKQWRSVAAFDRAKVLRQTAVLLRERSERIARLLTTEQGKPIAEARIEVAVAADIAEWFAEEARRTYGRIIPSRSEGVVQQVVKEPVGVVLAIAPWNFPIIQAVRKVAAALAAGCSVLLKAPEETPASPAEMVRAFEDAGLPPGTLNLLYGVPAEISSFLIAHPLVRKVSFTGSTMVGKQLAALAGAHMKRATMELGGHAPVIVCADADLERAASILVANKYRNCGQVCIAPTRFLVQKPVRDVFLRHFAKLAGEIRVGHGDAEGTTMGPLANARRAKAVQDLVSDAVGHGAQLELGGQRLGGEGFFHAPTVLTDVPVGARCMNDEPFGPIAIVNSFDTLDEAIAEANRLPYGLAAYAYTGSIATKQRLARSIESGMVSFNHHGVGLPETPFGGVKDSGYGSEGGAEAMEAYLNTKFISEAAP